MRSSKLIHIVGCHAEGEVGDVIVGGVAPPPGETLWDQSRFVDRDGSLRNFVLNEPRGGVFRHINLLVPAKTPGTQMGWIIMEPEDTPPMSGSNAICVATVLLETGILPMTEPITRLSLEAPGGMIDIVATCRDGKVEKVRFTNVPAFVQSLGVPLEISGMGSVVVDTAYGGDSFVIADAHGLGFRVVPDEARDIAEIGMRLAAAANEQLRFHHPTNPDWTHFSFAQIAAPTYREDGVLQGASAVVIRPGKIDRSPCGTGCSARMAVLHAQGELRPGDHYVGHSIIGSRFECRLQAETRIAEQPAILSTVSGRAWITSIQQSLLDPSDPYPGGYRIADTWPGLVRSKD